MYRRLCLPLIALLVMYAAGGCATATQAIADRVLVPAQRPERREYLAEERRQLGRRLGDRLKAFDYKAPDGTRLAALLLLPERHPLGVIVVLHGLTDSKEAVLDIAEVFADAGYLAVTPDLRAHGSSGGRYTSLGFHEKEDMRALLDHLQAEGCDVSRAGVIGGSLGAAVAIQWAGVDPRIKAVVAVAPFAELQTEMEYMFRTHGVTGLKAMLIASAAQAAGKFNIKDVSPIACVRSMDTPILLAHGLSDDIIPVGNSKRLFEVARGPVAMQLVEGKHVNIREALGVEFIRRSVDWMDCYVRRNKYPPLPEWLDQLPTRNFPVIHDTITLVH
jgi:alpha-beta hydrolase superfamily lysophospholipase